MTSTNGASSSSTTAWRNGLRNSSPPSVGESTLLCRLTFGRPGIAPSSTSSMPGWPAAVIDTESPSQLIPSEIQRMCTSCTPGGVSGSVAMPRPSLRCQSLVFEFQCVHEQLLATEQLEVEAAARLAVQREVVQLALGAAGAAAAGRADVFQRQLGAGEHRALCDQLEGELQRRGHDLAQPADLDLDAGHPALACMTLCDRDDGLGDRELVHQQIRGSGSPTSWSIKRRPPKAVRTSTIPGGSAVTVPISAAVGSRPRSASSAASACSGATKATSLPSLATYIGSMPSSSAAPATS